MQTEDGVSTGFQAREMIRKGRWRRPTAPLAPGYVQANLVVVPAESADDFEAFCHANPQPLPLLERLAPGSAFPRRCASLADLRTDLPRYRVYCHGAFVGETDSLSDCWPNDGCAFLLGCSFTFDALLAEAGIPVRHLKAGRNIPMYVTDRPLIRRGPFGGRLVVSLRPIPARKLQQVNAMTSALAIAHGGPIHAGPPDELGIVDILRPDYGDPPTLEPGDVTVFWACGVTAEQAVRVPDVRYAITHAPGHMFVTDLRTAVERGTEHTSCPRLQEPSCPPQQPDDREHQRAGGN